VKAQLIGFIGMQGKDSIVGTHQAAHGAPDAGIGGIGLLANAVKHRIDIGWRLVGVQRRGNNAFAEDAQFNGIDRAYCRAAAAEGALVLTPFDLPGQVFDA
jgi:hypothetical protein